MKRPLSHQITADQIKAYIARGLGCSQAAREHGVSQGVMQHAARRHGLTFPRAYYTAGKGITDQSVRIQIAMGHTLERAARELNVSINHMVALEDRAGVRFPREKPGETPRPRAVDRRCEPTSPALMRWKELAAKENQRMLARLRG